MLKMSDIEPGDTLIVDIPDSILYQETVTVTAVEAPDIVYVRAQGLTRQCIFYLGELRKA